MHKSNMMIHHINKWRIKNHIIISVSIDKAFHKISHLFMIKSSKHLAREQMYRNMKKAIYDKPTANTTLNGEKLKLFL